MAKAEREIVARHAAANHRIRLVDSPEWITPTRTVLMAYPPMNDPRNAQGRILVSGLRGDAGRSEASSAVGLGVRGMIPKRVLVLDGHTTQALACVRSLGRSGHVPLVASRRRWPLAGWSRWSAGYFRVGDDTPAAYADLRAWAVRQGVMGVLPMTERACLLCNAERGAWEAAGISVGCSDAPLLLRAFDKAQTLEAARACGVVVPPTRLPSS